MQAIFFLCKFDVAAAPSSRQVDVSLRNLFRIKCLTYFATQLSLQCKLLLNVLAVDTLSYGIHILVVLTLEVLRHKSGVLIDG